MTRKNKLITTVVAAVAAVAIIGLCASAGKKSAAGPRGFGGKAGAFGSQQSEAKSVKTSLAAISTLKPYIDEGGDVAAVVNVAVYPDIGGKLARLNVAIGDAVSKGEAIAAIDPSSPGSNYSLSSVLSPISGTVTAVSVEPGQTVTTSTAIAYVGIVDQLEVSVNLPERDVTKARKGMSANVQFEAMPGEKFAATVSKVSPVLDATSRTKLIKLSFDKYDSRINAGMYAKVRLYTDQLAKRLTIPEASVISRNDETFVFVVESDNGKALAKKRAVTTGVSVDGVIEVREGLKAGDKVVIEGQDLLSDGASVIEINGDAK